MTEERRQQDRRSRPWKFTDLVCDAKTGRLRETLLWSNVGKAIAAWALVYNVLHQSDTEMLWLIVMGILTAHELLSRYLSQRLPQLPKQEPAKT
jgi:hypothetical protein